MPPEDGDDFNEEPRFRKEETPSHIVLVQWFHELQRRVTRHKHDIDVQLEVSNGKRERLEDRVLVLEFWRKGLLGWVAGAAAVGGVVAAVAIEIGKELLHK